MLLDRCYLLDDLIIVAYHLSVPATEGPQRHGNERVRAPAQSEEHRMCRNADLSWR